MNILYIAYSCAPDQGSEDKIGWNVPIESAKMNRVYVITKEEHRESVEQYLHKNRIENITFYFVDIPVFYKKVFKGFLYSGRLNIWHRKAFPIAEEICRKYKIDIVHQITPIEFRSIGLYGTIPGIKFVCGPLGGGEMLAEGLKDYAKKHILVEKLRAAMNYWSMHRRRMKVILQHSDYIMFANYETREYMSCIKSNFNAGVVMTEIAADQRITAVQSKEMGEHGKTCRFLVVGRLIYRKGHDFLLDALQRIPEEYAYSCRIVGDGPELERLKERCSGGILSRRVIFTGNLPYSEISKEYENADVLIMPSLRETTGSVLLEAMGQGLPVVTINHFGGTVLLDTDAGWLYDGDTKEELIENLKNMLISCITQPEEVQRRGKNAKKIADQHTWREKIKKYQTIYQTL